MGKKTNHGKSGRKATGDRKGDIKKYRDENPLKDYQDYRKDHSGEKEARKQKLYGNFTNADTNNLRILEGRLKAMERINPAHRTQPDWDMQHEGLLQRVNGLKKLSKTVK